MCVCEYIISVCFSDQKEHLFPLFMSFDHHKRNLAAITMTAMSSSPLHPTVLIEVTLI